MFAGAKKFFYGEEMEVEQEQRQLTLLETPSLTMLLGDLTALEQLPKMADFLMQGKALILDLSALEETDKLRALDYMHGVCYTLEAACSEVGTDVYAFVPSNADIAKAR